MSQFDVRVHAAFNVLPNTKHLLVSWKRGPKCAATKVANVAAGEASWNETLTLVATLYRDPRSGRRCKLDPGLKATPGFNNRSTLMKTHALST